MLWSLAVIDMVFKTNFNTSGTVPQVLSKIPTFAQIYAETLQNTEELDHAGSQITILNIGSFVLQIMTDN